MMFDKLLQSTLVTLSIETLSLYYRQEKVFILEKCVSYNVPFL